MTTIDLLKQLLDKEKIKYDESGHVDDGVESKWVSVKPQEGKYTAGQSLFFKFDTAGNLIEMFNYL